MSAMGMLLTALCFAASGSLAAAKPPQTSSEGAALGLEVDLLPLVLSAADDRLGGAMNVWVGYDRLRLRAVASHIAFPDGFLTPAGFENRELTAAAGIVDFFFLPKFEGTWIGTGFEYWSNTISSRSGPTTASWDSWVATLGAGFVWRLWGNLYLNPWVAGHVLLSRPEVTLYNSPWTPAPLSVEASLKIGWFLWL